MLQLEVSFAVRPI